jgi:hypothetical protein
MSTYSFHINILHFLLIGPYALDTLIVPYKRKKMKKFKLKDSIYLKLVLKILEFCHLKWPLVYLVMHICLNQDNIFVNCALAMEICFPLSNKINNMIILIFHFSPSTSQLLISLCLVSCLVFQIMFQ